MKYHLFDSLVRSRFPCVKISYSGVAEQMLSDLFMYLATDKLGREKKQGRSAFLK